MLQPTSCGPGPPDKIVEFNGNELQQDNIIDIAVLMAANKLLDHKPSRVEIIAANEAKAAIAAIDTNKQHSFKVNARDNSADGDEVRTNYKMTHINQTTTKYPNSHECNSDNNNNCHLKEITFYFNKTTAAANSISTFFTSNASFSSYPHFSCLAKQWPVKSCLQPCTSFLTSISMAACGGGLTKFNRISSNVSNLHSLFSSKWILMILMLLGILAQGPQQVAAEKSKHYYMQSLCKNHFLQQLYRKIDGAVLWSQNERNLDCIITFQTHSILQRFMLRFDMLQLDCNDHLYVYDGAHAVATPKVSEQS
uniref:Uncharacterized protein n=1 Tax=Stomoxys calcitrans TaxID=35570 RepID=A0A1I8P0N5_STOCA